MSHLRRFLVRDLDPELFEYLLQLPDQKKREVAAGVSRLALTTNGLAGPLTDRVLTALDANEHVASAEVADIQRRVEALDEVYFAFAAEVEGPEEDGDPDDPRWPQVWALYRRARAMEALQCACDSDALEAVHEATYQCMAAVDSDFAAVRHAAGYVPGEPRGPAATGAGATGRGAHRPSWLERWTGSRFRT